MSVGAIFLFLRGRSGLWREDMVDVYKFRYLLKLVENDSRKAIKGLSVNNASHKEALDILRE